MIIEISNVYSKIIPDHHEEKVLQALIKKSSVFAPGYRYTYLFKSHKWDGKVAVYSENILTGLLPSFVLDLQSTYGLVPQFSDLRKLSTVDLKTTKIPLRQYQLTAIKAALSNQWAGTWWPRGVFSMATGSGKSHVAAAMIDMTNLRTLFIVHRRDLLEQTYGVFRDFGLDVGRVGNSHRDVRKVTIATIQTLQNMDITELSEFKQLFLDECQLVAADLQRGNQFVKISSQIPSPLRWGLSGTPFMKDKYSDRLLEGVTGSVVYEVNNRELINAGYLAEGKVTMYDVPPSEGVSNSWPECYDDAIVLNSTRNKKVIDSIKNKPKPVLVLVQKVGHGELLEKMATSAGLDVTFLSGKDHSDIRKKAKELLQTGHIDAILATSVWDEGIDIPEVRTVILAGGGKSPIKNLQRIGRGLRLSSGKNEIELVDFLDRGTRWLSAHSRERMKLWKSQGFAVTIV